MSAPALASQDVSVTATSGVVAGEVELRTGSAHSACGGAAVPSASSPAECAAPVPGQAAVAAHTPSHAPNDDELDELMALDGGAFDEDPFGHRPVASFTALSMTRKLSTCSMQSGGASRASAASAVG